MTAILILAALVLGILAHRYSATDERRWNEAAKLVRECGPLRLEL